MFDISFVDTVGLFYAAKKFQVLALINRCENVLKKEIRLEDVLKVFKAAKKYQQGDLMDRAAGVMAR